MRLQDAWLHSSAGLHGTMFVPQRPLAAPGSALWQQLCYPGADCGSAASSCGSSDASSSSAIQLDRQQQAVRPPDAHLLSLLRRVGLGYLLERVGGSFEAPADWAAMLSPGELQRLTVARVLHRYAAARLVCWLGEGDALWPAAMAARGLTHQPRWPLAGGAHQQPMCASPCRHPTPPNPTHRRPSLAVLDEVTSAVSEQAAAQLYGQLHAEGITCLRCGWATGWTRTRFSPV